MRPRGCQGGSPSRQFSQGLANARVDHPACRAHGSSPVLGWILSWGRWHWVICGWVVTPLPAFSRVECLSSEMYGVFQNNKKSQILPTQKGSVFENYKLFQCPFYVFIQLSRGTPQIGIKVFYKLLKAVIFAYLQMPLRSLFNNNIKVCHSDYFLPTFEGCSTVFWCPYHGRRPAPWQDYGANTWTSSTWWEGVQSDLKNNEEEREHRKLYY